MSMNLLLDTHAFLWFDSAPNRLSAKASALITDQANQINISVVTLWEICIKSNLGKLSLRIDLPQMIGEHEQQNGLRVLPIQPNHVYGLEGLPAVHKDPFDRMLVSVARCEGATLVSADAAFQGYPVSVEW